MSCHELSGKTQNEDRKLGSDNAEQWRMRTLQRSKQYHKQIAEELFLHVLKNSEHCAVLGVLAGIYLCHSFKASLVGKQCICYNSAYLRDKCRDVCCTVAFKTDSPDRFFTSKCHSK